MARTKKRALGYIRVSTVGQAENGAGLEVQAKAIAGCCRQRRWELVGMVQDAVTGEIAERPGLVEIEQALRAGEVGCIVIHRLDRLARDLMVQEYILAKWAALGAEVVSVLDGDALDEEPGRILARQIMGAVAQYDKAMVVARLRWGRQAKARKGGFAGGAVSLGYDSVDGKLVVNEEQARTVKRAAALRREGCGYRTIAATLAKEGYATKRGGKWAPNTVRRLLHSAQVQGRVRYGQSTKGTHRALIAGVR